MILLLLKTLENINIVFLSWRTFAIIGFRNSCYKIVILQLQFKWILGKAKNLTKRQFPGLRNRKHPKEPGNREDDSGRVRHSVGCQPGVREAGDLDPGPG